MLKQRVITALILMGTFLWVLFYFPGEVFAAFTGVVFSIALWEWSNLAGLQKRLYRFLYSAVSILVGLGLAWFMGWTAREEILQTLLLVACTWWVFSLLWIQSYPSSSVIWGAIFTRLIMGWLVVIPAWIACLYLRDEPNGAWLILMVVLLVAAADVGAYFSGRAFGQRKLAINVSPGKSWEGVWGGLLLAVFIGFLYNYLFLGGSWKLLLVLVIPTALISVIGDLVESMVKRFRGVKDSSRLLPGHGGVLDRIDGLVAATPVFALAVMMTNWSA